MIVRKELDSALGSREAGRRLVVTTDPHRGLLRRLAAAEGLRAFEVPPEIGGRFSVLTPVGLLPAAAAGADVAALVSGAAEVSAAMREMRPQEHPALLIAACLYLMDVARQRPIHVFMPYRDALETFSEWLQQLWGESLGKRRNGDFVGPTPIRCTGVTDQHSQLQLYIEGPPDKVVVFLESACSREDVRIPDGLRGEPEAEYLAGHSLEELLRAELDATAAALRSAGRPSCRVSLDRVDEAAMGRLFMVFEMATQAAGALYRINPFDQPGVEAGKRFACGLMGRPGYEAHRDEMARLAGNAAVHRAEL
jgi:glucose-6-phosphate isomerase